MYKLQTDRFRSYFSAKMQVNRKMHTRTSIACMFKNIIPLLIIDLIKIYSNLNYTILYVKYDDGNKITYTANNQRL